MHIIFPSNVFLSKLDENNISIPKKNGLKYLSLPSKSKIEKEEEKLERKRLLEEETPEQRDQRLNEQREKKKQKKQEGNYRQFYLINILI